MAVSLLALWAQRGSTILHISFSKSPVDVVQATSPYLFLKVALTVGLVHVTSTSLRAGGKAVETERVLAM